MHYEIIDYNSSRLQKTTVTIEEMTDQFNTGQCIQIKGANVPISV